MNPLDWLRGLGNLGEAAGDAASRGLAVAAGNAFDWIMQQIWSSALFVLRNVLEFIDKLTVFTVSKTDGPVSILWPFMLWVSGALAMGLFFWQLIVTVLRGGRGFVRLVSGPIQYGVTLAVSVGVVAAFLAVADELTTAILQFGLHSDKFADALHGLNLPDPASDTLKAAVLGLFGLAGTFPAAFGLGFEMVLREASIYIVVITIPLLAAGLVARATSKWFWKGCRVLLALIFLKPAIALVIAVGVAVEGGAQGFVGLVAGTMVLLISLWTPFVLFRLFAFVDPNTEAGDAIRDAAADAGAHPYGPDSLPSQVGSNVLDNLKDWLRQRGNDDEGDEDDANNTQEQANVDRFEQGADSASEDDEPIPEDDEPRSGDDDPLDAEASELVDDGEELAEPPLPDEVADNVDLPEPPEVSDLGEAAEPSSHEDDGDSGPAAGPEEML
ncbi:hypothetical protein ACQPXB_21260 [Amycolatopsis sp. CA-161197]|uniref:hypothetical protein n=1 Tax=Amycolatopsis sp. CA-161197 TaxID=3239922 RepID=UPI003D8EA758